MAEMTLEEVKVAIAAGRMGDAQRAQRIKAKRDTLRADMTAMVERYESAVELCDELTTEVENLRAVLKPYLVQNGDPVWWEHKPDGAA